MGAWKKPEFDYLQSNFWDATEKVDGTNIRVLWHDKFRPFVTQERALEFRGKTDKAQTPPFLLKKLEETFDHELMTKLFGDAEVCLYGEGYGAKIQKGGGDYIKDGVDFILFDARVGNYWLERDAINEIASSIGVASVPRLGYFTLFQAISMCQQGFESKLRETPPEGMVLRPQVEMYNRSGGRIIVKMKLKDFQ
jgi:hypothetical protein